MAHLKEDTQNMEVINFIHIPKNAGTSIRYIQSNAKKYKLVYNSHGTDIYSPELCNQLIIIRNPIERFASAVYYAMQQWGGGPILKYLIENGINTPEKWIQIWSNPNHKAYHILMSELLNTSKIHKIGDKILKYKCTYTPQSLWINNPKYIILMDNFSEEMGYFMKKTNNKTLLPNTNVSLKGNYTLSEKSKAFLKKFYKNDFMLYEKYKNMSIEERLPF